MVFDICSIFSREANFLVLLMKSVKRRSYWQAVVRVIMVERPQLVATAVAAATVSQPQVGAAAKPRHWRIFSGPQLISSTEEHSRQ